MKNKFNRRVFLKGAGSVLIGLPLLEESFIGKAQAQSAVPTRLLTMTFGLGIERDLQREGWNGPLEPFKDLSNKMAFFSNLSNQHLRGGGTVHFEVGATQMVGIKQNGTREANGPSLDQLMQVRLHPDGVPSATGVPLMSAGIWSRTGAVPQYMRHWNTNGSPGARPERRPSKVFERLFGNFMVDPNRNNNPDLDIERRIRQSVLDSVVDQANSLTGPNSYLGRESKDKINAHLESIRSIEQELLEGDIADGEISSGETNLSLPQAADYQDPSGIPFYDASSGPTTGPVCSHEAAQQAFRLTGKLYALGLHMDALRFGSLIFVGSGEHLRFSGNYNAANIGESLDFTKTFSSASPHDAIFHSYNQDAVRVYQHYVVSQLAYVLKEMDKLTDLNGETVLDNTLTVIGTEYGKNHESTGNIFHAVAGGGGRFRPGQYDSSYGFDDLYKTLMDSYNVPHEIGGSTISDLLT